MKDTRSAKKRKVSEPQALDEDGDTAMRGDDGDIYSNSSPARQDGDGEHRSTTSPTTTKASRRRPSRRQTNTEEKKDDNGGEEANGAGTPSRTGLRSSGRQRKPPKRYWEELESSEPAKKPTPTSTDRTRSTRTARKTSNASEIDETDWESPQPKSRTRTRTKPKRTSVRFNAQDRSDDEDSDKENGQSPAPDEYQDGLDDLVSMQLQSGLPQPDLDVKDTSVPAAEPLPGYAEEFQDLTQDGLCDELGTMTRFVLEKLNGKRPIPLKGLESEYQKVHQLIEQTVTAGEGNSMLVYGSRGCGKTTIVETAISSLKEEHGNDFHVVRLNGFLQTDDRQALREMWRQLGRETNTEDEVEKVSSHADTMATLLALLSHPEELFGPTGSKDGVTAAKSIVIILDEFDLFVSHARQTLLYNLFDIAQARKAPVAVIGLTTKVDITEILEKRVKSRFSHRYVFVPLPKSLDTFSDICHAGLDVEEREIPELSASAGADRGSVMESENWRTLLGGWRGYLKV
ncbi:Origin recognition complex subunit [Aspergillus sp. HF37]|nr:Origin recognition complex subunit [Aspergillus sp. HF37]